MDKETMIKYAPVALIVVGLIIQWNLFSTPTDLETKHREILGEVAEKYVTKDQYNAQLNDLKSDIKDLRSDVKDMNTIVNKMYDIMRKGK